MTTHHIQGHKFQFECEGTVITVDDVYKMEMRHPIKYIDPAVTRAHAGRPFVWYGSGFGGDYIWYCEGPVSDWMLEPYIFDHAETGNPPTCVIEKKPQWLAVALEFTGGLLEAEELEERVTGVRKKV